VLQEAYEGIEEYCFWLADDFSKAPRPIRIGDTTQIYSYEMETEPPIPSNWTCSFKGKSVSDRVAFLKSAPDNSCVDRYHIVVLGEGFEKRRLVVVYKIGDRFLIGDELNSLPCSARGATLFLSAMEPHYWEETKALQTGDEAVG
jgi:hypothetical protein